ncbi:MAG: aminoglycoside phosphotransferase family protein [Opitutaceae bacterium]|nr:aminoglycoside phosphotransferase family protein [Opitutaceae bacterium]
MHADEIVITPDLVRRLVTTQFPPWRTLELGAINTDGTVNAIFRLGTDKAVRLCRVPWGARDAEREASVLPLLAPHLPFRIPRVLGVGKPQGTYPWTWLVTDWIEGVSPEPTTLLAPERVAADLARFVTAMRRITPSGTETAYRGGPLIDRDAQTRTAIARVAGMIDTVAALAVWEEALRAPTWDGPPTWVHADLLPGNLLTHQGRLSGVLDFATAGMGDPACDLIPAWTLLPEGARGIFRSAVDADEAMWIRGRARALSIALIALPYYRATNPNFAEMARWTIHEILADARRHST